MLSRAEFRILQFLARLQHHQAREKSWTAQEVADELGISSSALSQYISKLESRGWARRESWSEGPGRVLYLANPGISVQWVSPRRRIGLEWDAHHEIDWEFPLVSQVEDPGARRTLKEFIRRIRRYDRSPSEADEGGDRPTPIEPLRLVLILYGSTARGDAGPEADLDVVAVLDEEDADCADDLQSMAANASLVVSENERHRPVQLITVTDPEEDLPQHLQEAIRREGLIVHDSTSLRLEGQIWGLVHGGRNDE